MKLKVPFVTPDKPAPPSREQKAPRKSRSLRSLKQLFSRRKRQGSPEPVIQLLPHILPPLQLPLETQERHAKESMKEHPRPLPPAAPVDDKSKQQHQSAKRASSLPDFLLRRKSTIKKGAPAGNKPAQRERPLDFTLPPLPQQLTQLKPVSPFADLPDILARINEKYNDTTIDSFDPSPHVVADRRRSQTSLGFVDTSPSTHTAATDRSRSVLAHEILSTRGAPSNRQSRQSSVGLPGLGSWHTSRIWEETAETSQETQLLVSRGSMNDMSLSIQGRFPSDEVSIASHSYKTPRIYLSTENNASDELVYRTTPISAVTVDESDPYHVSRVAEFGYIDAQFAADDAQFGADNAQSVDDAQFAADDAQFTTDDAHPADDDANLAADNVQVVEDTQLAADNVQVVEVTQLAADDKQQAPSTASSFTFSSKNPYANIIDFRSDKDVSQDASRIDISNDSSTITYTDLYEQMRHGMLSQASAHNAAYNRHSLTEKISSSQFHDTESFPKLPVPSVVATPRSASTGSVTSLSATSHVSDAGADLLSPLSAHLEASEHSGINSPVSTSEPLVLTGTYPFDASTRYHEHARDTYRRDFPHSVHNESNSTMIPHTDSGTSDLTEESDNRRNMASFLDDPSITDLRLGENTRYQSTPTKEPAGFASGHKPEQGTIGKEGSTSITTPDQDTQGTDNAQSNDSTRPTTVSYSSNSHSAQTLLPRTLLSFWPLRQPPP